MTKAAFNRAPMTGRRFERLVVIEEDLATPRKRSKDVRWTCLCDCGAKRSAWGSSLRKGKVTSCGCLKREKISAIHKKHGLANSSEYKTWKRIIQRCTNPNSDGFEKYGGRGIKVCPRWMSSFENFYADMGPRPPGMSIDRIDFHGDYEPGNCRWATPLAQTLNRRVTRNYTIDGRTQCFTHWCREYGVKDETVKKRMSLGWPIERALTERIPPGRRRKQ